MIKYVIKRILLLIPVFLGVTFVIFAIVRLNPADPVVAILGINITDEQYAAKAAELELTPEETAYLEEPYLPHKLVGVMAQNTAASAVEKHVWSTGDQKI